MVPPPSSNPMWMTYNISLAMIPVFLGWFLLDANKKWSKILIGFFWLLFLPNSIYLFADITHLFEQWNIVDPLGKTVLLIEYALVVCSGLLSYIYSLYPFEKLIKHVEHKRRKRMLVMVIIFLNFLVGFAIVLGRVQRINSWDVITHFQRVLYASGEILSSGYLLLLVILLGLFSNFLYFLLREPVIKYTVRVLKS